MSAAKKQQDGLTPPEQPEEVREANLARAPGGTETATGLEQIEQSGEREEPENRGSEVPIAGGDSIVSDFGEVETPEPTGAQALPAAFATNGSTDLTRVATPTGPQPVSAFASTPEEAQKLLERARENELRSLQGRARGRQELTEEKLATMNSAEIRAVAHDRGYDLPDHASKGLATRLFLKAQSEDDSIEGNQPVEETDEGGEDDGK